MTVLDLLDRMTAWEFAHWVGLAELDAGPRDGDETFEG